MESDAPPAIMIDGAAAKEKTVTEASSAANVPHPKSAQIVGQVNYYFGEENLRKDAHLLGLIEQGNGQVRVDEILGWNKMKRFKPRSAVLEALKQSQVVEIIDDTFIRRRQPLEGPVDVAPKVNHEPRKVRPEQKSFVPPPDQPWLTKNMAKPTGFEKTATEGPIKPEEYQEDRLTYDPELPFVDRIERAIMKFCARRKMHQATRPMLEKFLIFGGLKGNQRQFTGDLEEKSLQDYTKREIAELTSYWETTEMVSGGLHEDGPDGAITWVVDFEAVAKGFLSSQFMAAFDWYNEEKVEAAISVLRSFYNYLLYHDACPEYREQICAARQVCEIAGPEFFKLAQFDRRMPGSFNVACSTLYGGSKDGVYAGTSDWGRAGDDMGLSGPDATAIFTITLTAYGSEEQQKQLQIKMKDGAKFKVVSKDITGLEVVGFSRAEGEAKELYAHPRFNDTIVKPMGKLRCKRWDPPHAPPRDVPAWFRDASKARTFEFLVEESTLEYCYPGLKMEAHVHELDLGIKWIDIIEATYPSFFVWLPNERIGDYKKPGPPAAWMRSANERYLAEVKRIDDEADQAEAAVKREREEGTGAGENGEPLEGSLDAVASASAGNIQSIGFHMPMDQAVGGSDNAVEH